ncbi:MAG: sugar transferase [archaeon]
MKSLENLVQRIKKEIIFEQERIGLNGDLFKIYKFRTMYHDSESLYEQLREEKGVDEYGKIKNDPRITSIGNFLRKWRLDEMPQLYNILKSEMQVVGLRPLTKNSLDRLSPELIERRKKYKPGIISPLIGLKTLHCDIYRTKAEMEYLDEVEKNPVKTKLKYFLYYPIIMLKTVKRNNT